MENGAKKQIKLKSSARALFGANTGPFITGGSNQHGRAECSGKFYCIPVYVILN